MAGVQGAGAPTHEGDQFYVTHCAVADSVLDGAGYTVRAASTRDRAALEAALRYPAYELPIDMWKEAPAPGATPRRLARTAHVGGGVWAAHSEYLPKDTVGRNRSYFTHLLHLPAADPLDVLRSWGASGWCTAYPPGESQRLPKGRLPVGTLVSDPAVTAFLGDAPAAPSELSTTTCPPRLRGPAAARCEIFARMHLAALLLAEDENRRLYVHAEPGLIALLLYGALRLLPRSALADLTFSTFEPHHRNIRDYKLARVVGTYLGPRDKPLDADLAAAGLVLDTFDLVRSSPELRKPLAAPLPEGMPSLVKLASGGGWPLLDEIHRTVGGEWDVRGWLAEVGPYARGEKPPPALALSLGGEGAPETTRATSAPAPPSFLGRPTTPGDLGTLGEYRVLELLGEGGMGFVFRGQDMNLHRPVALKVMRPEIAASPLALERFLREGQSAAALRNDHVVVIYAVGKHGGLPFLAMELLVGSTLERWLAAHGGVSPAATVVQFAGDALRGLAAAHERGLVHRDIKPSNLWIEESGRLKVLDFGLTRSQKEELTAEGVVLGTPAYMSPEQASGKSVDARSDLFSLGIVLYQLLTGKNPFSRKEALATLVAVANDEPAALSTVAPKVPAPLAEFVHRLLSKSPPDRPADARAALAELAAIASQLGGGRAVPAPPPARSSAPEILSLDDDPPASVAPASGSRPAFGYGAAPKAPALPPSKPVGGMTYSAQISRTNPACLLFLIDQSKSMQDPFPGTGQTKAGVVADALNRLIQNVVLRSAKADGVRDYFRVGVIGYGQGVKAGLGGSIPFNVLVPVSKLGEHPLRVETRTKLIPDGVGGVLEQKVKFPVWFDAEASGQTPMCEAFAAAGLAVKGFVEAFPNAYPPLVLNLTDGMPTDGNPQLNARLLCNTGTSDGAALLFNLLITSKPVAPDYFPAAEDHLTDTTAKLLFRMSSVLPPKLFEAANPEGYALKPRARGVVINADPTAIVRFLDIGTRVTPSGK